MVKYSDRSRVILILISSLCIVSSRPLQLYNDPLFLDAEIRRIRAGKAGEPIKPPVIRGKTLMHLRSSEESSAVESGDGEGGDDDEYEYTSSEEIDVTCAPGKGWHHRGQRCVPVHCPGGTDQRDFNTGECLHARQVPPMGRYKPYSNWNSLNHVYRTHPAQRSLSRGMLSLLRRG
ncbi:uncharacterized protein LOC110847098 [Folsomia candida]|uniref:uncharacterized protein LOC110847098 n=1 Tax=Folsomia candida TaxID=158441 RepID=UPI0016051970|nr:uncharacterized protein LOC110847098 [Folsomia candida]